VVTPLREQQMLSATLLSGLASPIGKTFTIAGDRSDCAVWAKHRSNQQKAAFSDDSFDP
jgi:hypothetical protein